MVIFVSQVNCICLCKIQYNSDCSVIAASNWGWEKQVSSSEVSVALVGYSVQIQQMSHNSKATT